MNIRHGFWLCMLMCALRAQAFAEEQPFVHMEKDLAELKADFNDAADQVRLVFIVGPT